MGCWEGMVVRYEVLMCDVDVKVLINKSNRNSTVAEQR